MWEESDGTHSSRGDVGRWCREERSRMSHMRDVQPMELGPMSVSEYLSTPETNEHQELRYGWLVREAAPTTAHQLVMFDIHTALGRTSASTGSAVSCNTWTSCWTRSQACRAAGSPGRPQRAKPHPARKGMGCAESDGGDPVTQQQRPRSSAQARVVSRLRCAGILDRRSSQCTVEVFDLEDDAGFWATRVSVKPTS